MKADMIMSNSHKGTQSSVRSILREVLAGSVLEWTWQEHCVSSSWSATVLGFVRRWPSWPGTAGAGPRTPGQIPGPCRPGANHVPKAVLRDNPVGLAAVAVEDTPEPLHVQQVDPRQVQDAVREANPDLAQSGARNKRKIMEELRVQGHEGWMDMDGYI